jgi:hypothetical protein
MELPTFEPSGRASVLQGFLVLGLEDVLGLGFRVVLVKVNMKYISLKPPVPDSHASTSGLPKVLCGVEVGREAGWEGGWLGGWGGGGVRE